MKEKEILAEYLPEAMIDSVFAWIVRYHIHLKITRSRASKLGDYRPPNNKQAYHRITINHDLNPYAFFITFVHELAHLLTHKKYGRTVSAHGNEWKNSYFKLMKPFLERNVFPPDLQRAVYHHLQNIKASSHADVELTRTLMLFDSGEKGTFIEDLKPGNVFLFNNNRKFRMIEKLRKRYKCIEIESQRIFLFQPLTPVKVVANEE